MSIPPKAVFISYASQDRAVASRLRDALQAAGVEVWFDQEGLTGGDVWERRIREQIRDCVLFVPIISAATEGRLEGYFRREWRLAADRSLGMADARPFLLPLAVDDISELNAEVPEAFLKVQWTRLPGGEITPTFLERVRGLVHAPREIPPPSGATESLPTPAHRREPTRRLPYLAGALGIVLLLVIGYFVSRQFLSTRGSKASAGEEKSIAVLPFTDMSEKKDQEYFSDGMAEEILDILAKLPNLKVIARTSAFQFKGRTEDIRHIGEQLGARYVVEGSVRRSTDHLRITAQLIDASSGTHVWSQSYERPMADVLDIQQEVASGIARALQISVGADSSHPRARPSTPAAYEHYLRGELETEGGSLGDWEHAVGDYQAAIAIDPNFEPAWSGLAAIQTIMVDYGYDDDSRRHILGAREAAQRAIQLDPRSALGHSVLADVALDNYDWDTARREAAVARELEPGNAVTLQVAAKLAIELGQSQEAVSFISRGLELDPLFAGMHQLAEYAYSCSGRYKEAEAEIRQALRIAPQLDAGQSELAMLLMAQGRTEEAMAAARQESNDIERPFALAIVQDALGQHAAAEALLKTMPVTGDSDLAVFYGMRGDLDRAFSYLDKAISSGTARDGTNLPYVKCHVMWAPLRADKRFAAALTKLRLSP